MNCDRDLVFAYIEEDNIQRAHFRVCPLLTVHGVIQEEALRLWPDLGSLRIVPDRNEQHTFKERMRSLGHFCLMNLVGIPADANKIRTNKNYKPERGEANQFILYSDTVHALPEHTFFEVLEGSAGDYAALAAKAVTPLFYIQEGDTFYGPVRKAAPEAPSTSGEIAGVLYPLTCPDQSQRVMLCVQSQAVPEEKPAEASAQPDKPSSKPVADAVPAAKETEELPIGQELHILDEKKDFEDTLQSIAQPLSAGANLLHEEKRDPDPQPVKPASSGPLTGTPLYKANLRTSVPQPKNKLQEIVSSQWRVVRNDPPAEALPSGTAMQHVENPVELAIDYTRLAWRMPEARSQLVSFLLSLEGLRARLDSSYDTVGTTPLQRVLHNRLQDLEAERLTALVYLDKAKADLETFRKESVAALSAKARNELTALEDSCAKLNKELDTLRTQQIALVAQRDETLSQLHELEHNAVPAALAKLLADRTLTEPMRGIPLRMSGVTGKRLTHDEMVSAIMGVCKQSGVSISRNACTALLILLAVAPRIGVNALSAAAASTLLDNIVRAMGWGSGYAVQVSDEQTPVASVKPADSTPYICLTALPNYAPVQGVTKVFLSDAAVQSSSAAYAIDAWPLYPLAVSAFVPAVRTAAEPVSEASLAALTEKPCVSNAEINAALGDLLARLPALSAASDAQMRRFIACSAGLMEGGLPAALDWAILMWYIPHVTDKNVIRPLLDEYPLSLAAL